MPQGCEWQVVLVIIEPIDRRIDCKATDGRERVSVLPAWQGDRPVRSVPQLRRSVQGYSERTDGLISQSLGG